jgi:hypothetical protein
MPAWDCPAIPLEQRLGIVRGKATTALARRVGLWTAQYTQGTVLALLREELRVTRSVAKWQAWVKRSNDARHCLTIQFSRPTADPSGGNTAHLWNVQNGHAILARIPL